MLYFLRRPYSKNLQGLADVVDFRILSNDGTEAFRSNDTIRKVNQRLGGEQFSLHKQESKLQLLPADSQVLRQVIESGHERPVYEYDPVSGSLLLTFLAPIVSQEACLGCHGSNESVRGVVKLTMSLAQAQHEIKLARLWIFGLGTLIALLVMVVVHQIIRRSAVAPLERMATIMAEGEATTNLERFVPVKGCWEFRQVATAFNQLTTQLSAAWSGLEGERDKLTIIVLGAKEGIVVTDRLQQVVLVNPASERLLGKNEAQIRHDGFLHLFDDEDHMKALRDDQLHELPGMVWFNKRMLQVHASTILNGSQEPIGSMALIRDITREKALEDELRKISNTDALTSLFNRRHFDASLLEEYDRAKRYGLVLGLLLLDVDHFKRFNDEYGHDQGDRVLQALAELMQGHFRSVDYVCRYGGEEFCVIMPSTGAEGVGRSAERLRQRVANMVIDGLKVTISIGVAIFPEVGQTSPEMLIKGADLALYAAKKQGRNQVCYVNSEQMASLEEATVISS